MSHIKYKCIRCGVFETKINNEVIKHCNRLNRCIQKCGVILMSEDQSLVMTLTPYHNNNHTVDFKDLKHLSGSSIMYNNKDELFNELSTIRSNKIKCCRYCNENFDKITDLRTHIITVCFHKMLLNRKIEQDNFNASLNNSNMIIGDNNTTNNNNITNNNNNITNNNNNITNNNITNNTNNNNNYNLFLGIPKPFDEKWDISHISEMCKNSLIHSQFAFTKLLIEILKNEINSNVIIDNETDSGKIYMNDIKQYTEMARKDIIKKVVDKLYIQLQEFIDENKDATKVSKQYSRENIQYKFNNYYKKHEQRELTNEAMYDIYEEHKSIGEKMYNNVQLMNKSNEEGNIYKIERDNNNSRDNKTFNNELLENGRNQFINEYTSIQKIKESRSEDMQYDYDSDGNYKM